MAVTDDLPYPQYLAMSTGTFDAVLIGLNIDDSIESLAPGLTGELVQAVHDAIAGRPEFTGAKVLRADVTQTDITPAATG
jgi:hypothetical protein